MKKHRKDMELEIKNFQSWENQRFKFLPFTVIVGESNSGKTAIVRALEALLYNVPDGSYLRHGEKEYSITLKDGKSLLEYTKATSPKYKVNGEEFSPGRGSSERVGDLGYAEIEAEKTKIRPQISRQYDPPFLIHSSYSPSVTGAVLNNLSEAADAQDAKRKMEKDLKTTKSRLNSKQEQLTDINKQISHKVGWEEIEELVDRLSTYEEMVQEKYRLEETKNTVTKAKCLSEECEQFKSIFSLVKEQFDQNKQTLEYIERDVNTLEGVKLTQKQLELVEFILEKAQKLFDLIKKAVKRLSFFLADFEKVKAAKELTSEAKLLKDQLNEHKEGYGSLKCSLEEVAEELKQYPICESCKRPL